jgi:hypothetical protein
VTVTKILSGLFLLVLTIQASPAFASESYSIDCKDRETNPQVEIFAKVQGALNHDLVADRYNFQAAEDVTLLSAGQATKFAASNLDAHITLWPLVGSTATLRTVDAAQTRDDQAPYFYFEGNGGNNMGSFSGNLYFRSAATQNQVVMIYATCRFTKVPVSFFVTTGGSKAL